ncbi:hypothetical protein MHYP_G00017780 [Metynnis hypsauchen]
MKSSGYLRVLLSHTDLSSPFCSGESDHLILFSQNSQSGLERSGFYRSGLLQGAELIREKSIEMRKTVPLRSAAAK